MSNSLQGQISEDTLSSLLQFLAMNHNTGSLRLKQPSSLTGEIFFDEGRIVHAQYANTQGIQALAYFLSWKAGRFIFRNGVSAPEHTIHISLESALLEAAYQADISAPHSEEVTITTYSVLQPNSLKDQTLVSLSFGALNLLRVLDGKRDLATIANDLGWSEDRILSAAQELQQQELIQIHSEESINGEFIGELRKTMVYIMGPIGEFVVDDALNSSGADPENLTQSNAQEFLREIALQLEQANWRQSFDTEAAKICRKYGINYKIDS